MQIEWLPIEEAYDNEEESEEGSEHSLDFDDLEKLVDGQHKTKGSHKEGIKQISKVT